MRFKPLALTAALALPLFLSTPSSAQDNLPEGPGKAALQDSCTQCHDLGTAIGQKRAPEDWADVLDRMSGLGLTITEDRRTEILSYLNANFGSAPAPAAVPAGATTPKKP